MSFMSFTLYPGGAFMMCESLSEFDANASDADTVVNTIPPQEQQKMISDCCDGDIVVSTLNALGDTYDNIVRPIMSMELVSYDYKEFAEKAQTIGNAATNLTDRLRKLCVEMKTIEELFSVRCGGSVDFMYGDLKTNLAFFIKNMSRLKQLGYGNTSYNNIHHPAFAMWATNRFARTMLANFEAFHNNIIDMDIYASMSGDSTMKTSFESILDMMNTMFHNPERRIRQEQVCVDIIDIGHLIQYDLGNDDRPVRADSSECEYRTIINRLSAVLRTIKQRVYNIQVDMLDKTGTPSDEINKSLYEMCTMLTNIFIVTTVVLISYAYTINGYIAKRDAIASYVRSAMSALK